MTNPRFLTLAAPLLLFFASCTLYTPEGEESRGGQGSTAGWADAGIVYPHDAGGGSGDGGSSTWHDAAPSHDAGGYPYQDAAVPYCSGLSEAECIVTVGCEPLYSGINCSCSAGGCVCDDWEYSRCE